MAIFYSQLSTIKFNLSGGEIQPVILQRESVGIMRGHLVLPQPAKES